jgi:apolipoprotein N-acyltransferase
VDRTHVAGSGLASTEGAQAGAGDAPARRLRLLPRLALAAVSGVVLAVAFPPYGLWWLTPLAVAAITILVLDVRPRTAALVGLVAGLGFFLLLLRWLLVIGSDAWVLLSTVEALALALVGVGTCLVARLPGWPVYAAAVWVAGEELRAVVPFGGFPWGRLAYAQAQAPFKGLAAVGGMALVTFAVALCGALLAAAVRGAWGSGRRPRRVAALAAGAAVAALVGLAVPLPTDGPTVTAAVVQGNVPQSGLDAFGQRAAVLDNHVRATEQLGREVAAGTRPQPALVVWPENSTDIDPYADASAAAAIQGAVDAVGAPTLVGAVVTNPDDPTTVLNLGIVWGPTGTPAAGPGETYAKRHPVPFGEYVPFRSLLTRWVSRLDRIPRDFAAGDTPGLLQLGPVRIGDVICFEVAYDPIVQDVAKGEPGLLVVQTNNATYGRTGQPDQQLEISRMRAVQTGRTVLVAATSGLSAVIAADGHITAGSHEFEPWVYDGPVTVRTGETLATRLGPWPGLLLGTLGVGAVAWAIVRRRRERSPSPDASSTV